MSARPLAIALVTFVAACGGAPERPTKTEQAIVETGGDTGGSQGLTAADHTPGFFRDTFRILEAQRSLDDATAVERMLVDYAARVADPGALPALSDGERRTLEGLLIQGWRSLQATAASPANARAIGEGILHRSLGLDPALDAFNAAGGHAKVTEAGAQSLASAIELALQNAAAGHPSACAALTSSDAADFDAGEPVTVWVDEVCAADEWVGGYCEQDQWIEGQCHDEWVPEQCSGGTWVDNGTWEYVCYDSDDCRTEWRERWEYVEGTCDGGYWDQWCDAGTWEPGLCYDGTFVPGACEPGHNEYRYPDGVWSFAAVSAPSSCEAVRPSQYAIAATGAMVLAEKARVDLDPTWGAALDALVRDADLNHPDEATYDAILQIVDAVAR